MGRGMLLYVPCTSLLLRLQWVAFASSLWPLLIGERRRVQSLPTLPAGYIPLDPNLPDISYHVLFIQWLLIYSYNSALHFYKHLLYPTHFFFFFKRSEPVFHFMGNIPLLYEQQFIQEAKQGCISYKDYCKTWIFFVFLTPSCLLWGESWWWGESRRWGETDFQTNRQSGEV